MAKKKKIATTPNATEDVAKLDHSYLTSENEELLWKTFWQILRRLNMQLPYNTAITLLGIYLREICIHL